MRLSDFLMQCIEDEALWNCTPKFTGCMGSHAMFDPEFAYLGEPAFSWVRNHKEPG